MLKTKHIFFSMAVAASAAASSSHLYAQDLGNPDARSGRDNSPYSMFGIGTLNQSTLTSLRGMGGNGAAYTDPFSFNVDNPASYSFLRYSSLEFSADLRNRNVTFDGQPSKSSFTGSINNLQVGIPLKNVGGLSFGIHQVSNIYYNLTDTINILTDRTIRQFAGNGGFQKAYVGFAVEKYNLSLGMNFGYTFGQVSTAYNIFNFDNANLRDFDDEYNTRYKGLSWNFGGLYKVNLKNDRFINIGASYQLESQLDGNKNGYTVAKTYKLDPADGTQKLLNADTINSFVDHKGKLVLPSIMNVGIHFGKHEHFDVIADFKYYDWSKYHNFGNSDSIAKQSFKSSLGFSYTPDYAALYKSGESYFSAVTYRAGVFLNRDYVYLRNTHINDIGGTIGFGFPIRRTMSNHQFGKINTAITIGNRGTYANGLAREFYFSFTFGASLNDIWFIKPVYD